LVVQHWCVISPPLSILCTVDHPPLSLHSPNGAPVIVFFLSPNRCRRIECLYPDVCSHLPLVHSIRLRSLPYCHRGQACKSLSSLAGPGFHRFAFLFLSTSDSGVVPPFPLRSILMLEWVAFPVRIPVTFPVLCKTQLRRWRPSPFAVFVVFAKFRWSDTSK